MEVSRDSRLYWMEVSDKKKPIDDTSGNITSRASSWYVKTLTGNPSQQTKTYISPVTKQRKWWPTERSVESENDES